MDMKDARSAADVADDLGVSRRQANEWLSRLVKEGALEKIPKPVRYRVPSPQDRYSMKIVTEPVADDIRSHRLPAV